jgi:multicomponent Na+:H+ antiporter subunit F
MDTFYLGIVLILLGTILVGLLRVLRGPTPADRMLAAQLFGTTGVAMTLLLAEAMEEPAIRNVGLTFALLAVIATVVFAQRDAPSKTAVASRNPQAPAP